jgi:stage III sporulation protein AF
MDWLGGWLKTIVLVILLATFVDLLLPSSKMQRYVKTVMSLFILLTLLSPILKLFQPGWNADRLLAAADYKQNAAAALSGSGRATAMTSLDTITQEAERLKAEGQKQSQQLLQTQIAEAIKQDLQKQTDLMVDAIHVKTQIDNNGKPFITDVQATLHAIEPSTDGKQPELDQGIAVMAPVHPIAPVQIDIQSVNSSTPRPSKDSSDQLSAPLEQKKQALIQTISQDWQVPTAHIDVHINQG